MYPQIPYDIILRHLPVLLSALPALMAVCTAMVWLLRWRDFALLASGTGGNRNEKTEASGAETAPASVSTPLATASTPYISIVVPSRNECQQLQRTLDALLSQGYTGRFEVIVADQLSSDGTALLLKRMQTDNPRLRSTFVPASSRHIELRKLAVTLGVRAARGEWVVVVNAGSVPYGAEWLTSLAGQLTPARNLVMAYTNFDDDKSYRAHRIIYRRLAAQAGLYRDWRGGRVTHSPSEGYAVRKSWFLQCGGFADSLSLPFGEEAIFAARHAVAAETAVTPLRAARLIAPLPGQREWRSLCVEHAETRRHLGRVSRLPRLRHTFATCFFWLFYAAFCLFVAGRVVQCLAEGCYAPDWRVALDSVVLLVLILWHAAPLCALRRCCDALDERRYHLTPFTSSLARPLRCLATECRRYRHRRDFVRKYMRHE